MPRSEGKEVFATCSSQLLFQAGLLTSAMCFRLWVGVSGRPADVSNPENWVRVCYFPYFRRMFVYGVLWYSVVWYGMLWCGVVWYGMVWYGMVLYSVVLYDAAW